MSLKSATMVAMSFAAVGLSSCATVNPQHDYELAARHVSIATGQDAIYRPGDEHIIAEKVQSLFADGLTADEAVQVALLNNQGLQAAFMDVGMARADVVQAGLFSNPFVGISARFPDGGGLANIEARNIHNM